MATAPINPPQPTEYIGHAVPIFRPKAPAANSTAFVAGQFVKTPSAVTKLAAGDTTVFGWAQEDATATTATPPSCLYAGYTSVQDVRNTFFLVNITDGSGTIGSGTTTQAAVAIGTAYELIYGASPYTAVQMLNAAATTNKFFKVESLWPKDLTTDYNGRVLASIASTVTFQ